MLRQEVTAEFFSAPQRALLGADEAHFTGPDGKRISPLEALIGGMWALPDVFDEDEQKLVRAGHQATPASVNATALGDDAHHRLDGV